MIASGLHFENAQISGALKQSDQISLFQEESNAILCETEADDKKT